MGKPEHGRYRQYKKKGGADREKYRQRKIKRGIAYRQMKRQASGEDETGSREPSQRGDV
jgi:hypothetical protein